MQNCKFRCYAIDNFLVLSFGTKNLFFQLGLPLRFIREVPSFSSQRKEEMEIFQRTLEEDLSKQRVPLLFLAGAG